MPVQGLVRLRKHQFGRQLIPGTPVAATRAYPHSGVPEHELNRTDPEIDAGSRDITAPPFRDAPDLTVARVPGPLLQQLAQDAVGLLRW